MAYRPQTNKGPATYWDEGMGCVNTTLELGCIQWKWVLVHLSKQQIICSFHVQLGYSLTAKAFYSVLSTTVYQIDIFVDNGKNCPTCELMLNTIFFKQYCIIL